MAFSQSQGAYWCVLSFEPKFPLYSIRSGDMQLTRAEVAETQIIVTTPEKWDVVTRKPVGEGELTSVRIITFSDASHCNVIFHYRN